MASQKFIHYQKIKEYNTNITKEDDNFLENDITYVY